MSPLRRYGTVPYGTSVEQVFSFFHHSLVYHSLYYHYARRLFRNILSLLTCVLLLAERINLKLANGLLNDRNTQRRYNSGPDYCQSRVLGTQLGIVHLRGAVLLLILLIDPIHRVIQLRVVVPSRLGSRYTRIGHVFEDELFVFVRIRQTRNKRSRTVSQQRTQWIVRVLSVISNSRGPSFSFGVVLWLGGLGRKQSTTTRAEGRSSGRRKG
jgi:hypothetical protein